MEIAEVDHKVIEIHGKGCLIGSCSKNMEKMLPVFICESWSVLQEHWNKLFVGFIKRNTNKQTNKQTHSIKKSSVFCHWLSEMKFD
jgi:hypothetical protein